MSRTFRVTPTRRSRRLLHNGYYYASSPELPPPSDDDDDNVSIDSTVSSLHSEPRSVTYEKTSSPQPIPHRKGRLARRGGKRAASTAANGGGSPVKLRAAHSAPRNTPEPLQPAHKAGVHVTKQTVRTVSRTSLHETTTRVTQNASAPNLTTVRRQQQQQTHQIRHMYGLEDADDAAAPPDRYPHNVHASGESHALHHHLLDRERRREFKVPQAVPRRAMMSGRHAKADNSRTSFSDQSDIDGSFSDRSSDPCFEKQQYRQQPSIIRSTVVSFSYFLQTCLLYIANLSARTGRLVYQGVTCTLVLDTWLLRHGAHAGAAGKPSKSARWLRSAFIGFLYLLPLVVFLVGFAYLLSLYVYKAPSESGGYLKSFQDVYSTIATSASSKINYAVFEREQSSTISRLQKSIHNLEDSLRSLELTVAEKYSRSNSEIADLKATREKQTKELAWKKEEAENLQEKRNSELERFLSDKLIETTQGISAKIIQLQLELQHLSLNGSAAFKLVHDQMKKEGVTLKDDVGDTKRHLGKMEESFHDLEFKLQLLQQEIVNMKKESGPKMRDLSELHPIIDDRFIENFLHLLQSSESDKTSDDKSKLRYLRLAVLLTEWIRRKEFMQKGDLHEIHDSVVANLTADIRYEIDAQVKQQAANKETKKAPGITLESISQLMSSGSISESSVKQWIDEALDVFSADRIGLADFALESAGGHVVNTRCSETYDHKTALVRIFGIPLYYNANTPRTIIQPSVMPGECWAFKGHEGYVVIGLSAPVIPSSITLEHIPRSLALFNVSSAPKDFAVYGLVSPADYNGDLLGNFRYVESGSALQNFALVGGAARKRRKYGYIELRVTSNWGHPDFTCLYRFRVHGTRG